MSFFVVAKLIAYALAPVALMIEMLLLGLLLRWRWLVYTSAALFAVCLILPVGNFAINPLEDRFPQITDPPAHVDGIVVLGGAIDDIISADRNTPSLNNAANRMTSFAILARRYPEARLVFTGGSGAVVQGVAAEAPFARALLTDLGVPPERVIYEEASRTTWENAVEVNKLVQPKPGEVWVLLTSAAHMPRSVGVFRAAGWTVLAWPVGYRSRDVLWNIAPAMGEKLAALEIAVHEWQGLLFYWLQGHSTALFPAP